MGNIRVLQVTSLKLFSGSHEEAYKAALMDAKQFIIRKTYYWRGIQEKSLLVFLFVELDDGDRVLLP